MSLVTDGLEVLDVALEDRKYSIFIGDGSIDRAGALVKGILRTPRAIIVTDSNVAPHWLGPLRTSLNAAGIQTREIIMPPGEATKSFEHLQILLDDLLQNGVDRKTTLFALGGGVVGDLTGFAAAICLRGIDFVQVPTSLLAQVDSSVGGKTGIDTRQGKNLVGAFHQPRAVIVDTRTLDTLPRRERLCGYAEVIKYGVINDRAFFDWLSMHGQKLIDGDPTARAEAIRRSCANKAAIVAADEREAGLRALLNLGHTFGHAIEAQVGFEDKLKHGEAVAIGMIMAMDLSVDLGLIQQTERDEMARHLEAIGLPTGLQGLAGANWTSAALLEHMGRDKKTEGGKLTFILTRAIGHSFVAPDVDPALVGRVLDRHISSAL